MAATISPAPRAAALVAMAAAIAAAAAAGAPEPPFSPARAEPELEIGALAVLGDEPFHDRQRLEAARIAAEDFNADPGAPFRVRLSVHEFDRGAALDSMRRAHLGPGGDPSAPSGPSLYVGPTTSGPVAEIAEYVNGNGIVVVSPASSAVSLAVEGDGIFRTSPDGSLQAAAIVALVAGAGVDRVVLVAQDDAYGRDLDATVTRALHAHNAQVAGRVFFERLGGDWGPAAAEINSTLASLRGGKAGVLFAGVDSDFAALARLASSPGYGPLRSAEWFDSGAVENSALLAADAGAFGFAESVNFTTPVPSSPPNALSARLDGMILERTGAPPRVFSYGAYDAVFLLARAAEAAGFPGPGYSPAGVRDALVGASAGYEGALGPVLLDAAGDLVRPDDHAVWEIEGGAWVGAGTVHAAAAAAEVDAILAESPRAVGVAAPAGGPGGGAAAEVRFSRPVFVEGGPPYLEVGPAAAAAPYASGSGTDTLAFAVPREAAGGRPVHSGEYALVPNGSSISGAGGRPALLALPAPPAAAVAAPPDAAGGGGCLIATAAYGTELAPQVQLLREFRDAVAGTGPGAALVSGASAVYYAFSPAVADAERRSPEFREAVRAAAAPALRALAAAAVAAGAADPGGPTRGPAAAPDARADPGGPTRGPAAAPDARADPGGPTRGPAAAPDARAGDAERERLRPPAGEPDARHGAGRHGPEAARTR